MKVRTRLAIAVLSAAGILSVANITRAQDQLPVPTAPKNDALKDVCKEAGPLSQASRDVLRAAVGFHMSGLANGKELPDRKRYDLEVVLGQIASEDGQATASKEAMDLIQKVLTGKYSSAAKINAMILFTELSEGPANARIPYTPAVNELYRYATNDKAPCHLRSLALVGLDRHARTGKTINDPKAMNVRNSITVAITKIIASQPADAAQEQAHWWMVRRAYDVLNSMHVASEKAKDPLAKSEGLKAGIILALDQFTDPTQLTSIRYSAGTFLTRFDFTPPTMKTFRMRIFLGVAQFLDQEVVGWYEQESDKSKMQSGGMMGGMGSGMGGMGMGGMMGGMGGMSDGGMGAEGGMGGSMGGYGGMGGGGEGLGGGGRGGATGPKPIDIQQWDLRLARRKLNMYTQLCHALLKGTLAKEEKDYSPSGKGVMEVPLPESHQRAGKFIIEALESVQENINEKTMTSLSSLMARLLMPLTKLRDAVELVPAYVDIDPADPKKEKTIELVKSFKDYSPRMKSFKKADASGKLESTTAPPPGADGAAAGANGAAAGAPAAPGAEGANPAQPNGAGAVPAGAAPAGAAPGPAGAAPAGVQPNQQAPQAPAAQANAAGN